MLSLIRLCESLFAGVWKARETYDPIQVGFPNILVSRKSIDQYCKHKNNPDLQEL